MESADQKVHLNTGDTLTLFGPSAWGPITKAKVLIADSPKRGWLARLRYSFYRWWTWRRYGRENVATISEAFGAPSDSGSSLLEGATRNRTAYTVLRDDVIYKSDPH